MVMPGSKAAELAGTSARIDGSRPATGPSRRMRLLYVVSMFPSWPETFIRREIRTLLDEGVDVRIVSLRHPSDELVQPDAQQMLSLVHYPRPWYLAAARFLRELVTRPAATLHVPLRILAEQWHDPGVMAKSLVAWFRSIGLLREIERFAPDHIHAHWATYASTGAMVIARHLQRSFSFTAHAHDIFVEDQLMDDKLSSAAFVATISRFNRNYLRARYSAAEDCPIEVIHCGVPERELPDHARPNEVLTRQVPLLVSVGRHDEVKGFPTLLQACRILRDKGMEFRCEIVGDGPLRSKLEQMIEELQLQDCVTLLGARPSDEVARKLSSADLFVLASERSRQGNMDGIPVALMEAMASGTPVVSTRISGIPELVEHEHTGLLTPPRDPVALARNMQRALDDAALRERCIDGARRRIRSDFNADTEARKLLNLIRTITGERSAEEVADSH